jgi:hypothetical protein
MNKHLISNTKTLVNNSKTAFEVVYYGVNHTHNGQLAQFVSDEGCNTIKQFIKTDFSYCGELSAAKLEAIKQLQNKLNKYMGKQTKPVTKKVKAKKQPRAVAKKEVAKKLTKKETIKQKYQKMYKIVTNYSENLMQDVYSVVYRTKTLKRFVNTNLANKYIEQEVLVRMGEHSIKTAKKSRAVAKEIEAEFE